MKIILYLLLIAFFVWNGTTPDTVKGFILWLIGLAIIVQGVARLITMGPPKP